MKTAIELIAEERQRQIKVEGWTPEHDSQHVNGELADAAACYALTSDAKIYIDEHWGNDNWLHFWPFELKNLKLTPDDRIRELVKSAALLIAEIERLQSVK